jgi:TldD protein
MRRGPGNGRKWLQVAAAAVACLGAVIVVSADTPPPDPLLQAMQDELERSKKIAVTGLEAPYFLEYGLDEADTFSVSASLGGIVSRRNDHIREPEVRVRVGDYKFDNSNFSAGAFNFGSRYDLGRFPMENTYPVVRRYFWLYTDSAYKTAVEALSRKRAALRNVQNEQLADFAHAEPIRHIHAFQPLTIDGDAWTNKARTLSGLFVQFPEVRNSTVDVESSAGGLALVNSEGTVVREPENVTMVRVRAVAQAADGMAVWDAVTFHSLDPLRMPTDGEMTRGINALGENLTALARAPKGEDYSGPVLFEGAAGAQIMAEVLGKNLALTRRPISNGGRGGGFAPSELEGRLGARVLPESFDVVDDPTQKEWRGRPLFGTYDVDREGVTAKPLRLVEKGVLKGYLLTRQPVRGFEGSNGRARLPGRFGASTAGISNLFVSSSEAVPAAELKKKLIELTQARGLPFGILVRKMDFPSSASFEEAQRMLMAAQGQRPVSAPILVYKVFPDGREELVRGLRFRGLTARSLKDIVAAGNDSTLFEFMDNAAPFALIGGAEYTTEACVVAPSLLVDDLELHPVEQEQPRLPVAPPPEFTR